jgi:hypothetical protein
MTFTVVWDQDADDKLTTLWIQAETKSERDAITDAAYRIDRELRRDPYRKALPLEQPSGPPLWLFRADPLAVVVQVKEQDRLVRVLQVELASFLDAEQND